MLFKKNNRRKKKLKLINKRKKGRRYKYSFNLVNNRYHVKIVPPENFSLINNAEETMKFFVNFVEQIEDDRHGKVFFIDSSNVETVTVDAIIYLIAIIHNQGSNVVKRYSYHGNFPKNETANKIYRNSGFLDYVKTRVTEVNSSNEIMKIVSGLNNEPDTAKLFCQFVMEKLNKVKTEIIPLQIVLIELMSNVFHHAYDGYEKHSFMIKRWFIYAEHVEDYIRFVFVDTGYGIAKTVKKNFPEKIKEVLQDFCIFKNLGVSIKDSDLIESVFNGDFRTSTNEKHRGNGLKEVRDRITNSIFNDFEVISGKGRCSISNRGSIVSSLEYNNKIYGTLFTFCVR